MASGFLKVRCECKNEQVIFSKASTPIVCLVCGAKLATSTGGKALVTAQVVEVLQ